MLTQNLSKVGLSLCLLALVFTLSCSAAKDSAKFAAKAAEGGMAEVALGNSLWNERLIHPSKNLDNAWSLIIRQRVIN